MIKITKTYRYHIILWYFGYFLNTKSLPLMWKIKMIEIRIMRMHVWSGILNTVISVCDSNQDNSIKVHILLILIKNDSDFLIKVWETNVSVDESIHHLFPFLFAQGFFFNVEVLQMSFFPSVLHVYIKHNFSFQCCDLLFFFLFRN